MVFLVGGTNTWVGLLSLQPVPHVTPQLADLEN